MGADVTVVRDFYEARYGRLVVQLAGMTGSRELAEEALQEAFVRALDRPAAFARLDNPEAWLRTVAGWFAPVAEIPVFTGKAVSSATMSDAALLDLLARHPIPVDALAASAGVDAAVVERRLAPLVASGKLAIDLHDGVRTARVVSA